MYSIDIVFHGAAEPLYKGCFINFLDNDDDDKWYCIVLAASLRLSVCRKPKKSIDQKLM